MGCSARGRRSLAFLGLAPDAPVEPLDDGPHEVQAEARPFRLEGGRVVGAIELFEQPRMRTLGNPDARVPNRPVDHTVSRLQRHVHASAGGRVFDRIRHQVEHDLTEQLCVCANGGDALIDVQGQLVLFVDHQHAQLAHHVSRQVAEIDVGQRRRHATSLQLREIQQVADELDESEQRFPRFDNVCGHLRLIRLLGCELEYPPHACERRSKLVADKGREIRFDPIGQDAFGDVAVGALIAGDLTIGAQNRHGRALEVPVAAILVPPSRHEAGPTLLAGDEGGQQLVHPFEVFRVQQRLHIGTGHLCRRPAQRRFTYDGIARGLEDRGERLQAVRMLSHLASGRLINEKALQQEPAQHGHDVG